MFKKALILASVFAAAGAATSTRVDAQAQVEVRRGSHFTYALPAGWTVGEEGPFALTLRAQDGTAGIVVYGQSGMLNAVSPQQFAEDVMSNVFHVSNLHVLGMSPIQPQPGCAQAAQAEVTYTTADGKPMHGVITCNVAVGYQQCNATMTLAGAVEPAWNSYRSWLPQVAAQVVNSGANAYGGTTIGRQNLNNSIAQGQQQQDYFKHSADLQAQVQADRDRSQKMQSYYMGQMLTGNAWYNNPYGGSPTYQSMTPASQWMNPNGNIATGDNPTFDPRTPTDNDWRRMQPQTPDDDD